MGHCKAFYVCVCVCVCVCMFINYLQKSIASFPKGLSVFFLEISRSVCTAWQPHSLEHRQPCTLVQVSCSSTWVTARMTSGYSSEVPEMNRVWPSSSWCWNLLTGWYTTNSQNQWRRVPLSWAQNPPCTQKCRATSACWPPSVLARVPGPSHGWAFWGRLLLPLGAWLSLWSVLPGADCPAGCLLPPPPCTADPPGGPWASQAACALFSLTWPLPPFWRE